jgi:hypothetical protein
MRVGNLDIKDLRLEIPSESEAPVFVRIVQGVRKYVKRTA